jgi:hypothetical protein
MAAMRAILATLVVAFFAQSLSGAQPDLTPLQPPTIVMLPCVPPAFEQPSRLAVWQYYAVDRSGHFRPRVPLTTEPYNRATIQPRIYIPYIFD